MLLDGSRILTFNENIWNIDGISTVHLLAILGKYSGVINDGHINPSWLTCYYDCNNMGSDYNNNNDNNNNS